MHYKVDDGDIIFISDDGSGGTTAYITLDGGEGHMIASKELNFADGVPATFGNTAGGDLEIKEQSGGSYILNNTGNLQIQNHQDDGDIIFNCDDGSGGIATYFRLDGANAQTEFERNAKFLDNIKLMVGTGEDLQMYHDGTNSALLNATGDLYIMNSANDKDIIFQSDDGSGGVETYFFLDGSESVVTFPDDKRLTFGTDRDLFLYHTGSEAQMKNYTGQLTFTQEVNDGDIVFKSDNGSGGTTAYITLDGGDVSTIVSTIKVMMPNLPTSDPSTAGQLWNDSGTLKISAG